MAGWTRLSRILAVSLLAGGGLVPAAAASTPATRAPAVPANGRIVFSSGYILVNEDYSQPSQVFSVRPDGSELRQLTHVPEGSEAGAPDVSPNGRRIVYISNVSGRFAVWTMWADGSHQHRLFGARRFDYFQPRWSPDGTRLAVIRCDVRFGFTAACDIDVANSDGTGRHRVVGGHRFNVDPAWSPDGTRLAFAGDRAGFLSSVWVVNVEGGRPTRLTKPNLEAGWPSWSPNGARIVFSSNCCRPHSEVYVMDSDGSHLRQLTHFAADHGGGGFASYSPNGRRIVLSSDARRPAGTDKTDLFTMHADGSHLTRIVTDPPAAVLADWGPRREKP
jgi:Tol biopolymer transport system component